MESNNAVVMICIDSDKSKYQHSTWGLYAERSWKQYCKKYNLDFILIDNINNPKINHPKWMKSQIWNYVSNNCDRILLVDSDTMPSWRCENIFETFTHQGIYGVEDHNNLAWLNNSVKAYQKFFPDINLQYKNYVNSGILLMDRKSGSSLCNLLFEFYLNNKKDLDQWDTPNTGIDQTPINFILQKHQIKLLYMPHMYNQFGIFSLGLNQANFQQGSQEPYFLKTGKIWHFTGMPVDQRESIMKQIWGVYSERS